VSPVSGGVIAGVLRSYLRFRAFEGDLVEHLLPVIGSPARWRLAPLPQTLSRVDVERLLDAFPPGLPSRLRSYAIVRCIVDLGLRTHEVSSLALDDIDWAAGTLRIAKGKITDTYWYLTYRHRAHPLCAGAHRTRTASRRFA
jgi:integrase